MHHPQRGTETGSVLMQQPGQARGFCEASVVTYSAAYTCRYFEEKKSKAEEGCNIAEGDREWGSAQCSNLERLEDFVRQFVGQAPTDMFMQTLLVLQAADQRAANQASSKGLSCVTSLTWAQPRSRWWKRRILLFISDVTDVIHSIPCTP